MIFFNKKKRKEEEVEEENFCFPHSAIKIENKVFFYIAQLTLHLLSAYHSRTVQENAIARKIIQRNRNQKVYI